MIKPIIGTSLSNFQCLQLQENLEIFCSALSSSTLNAKVLIISCVPIWEIFQIWSCICAHLLQEMCLKNYTI